ncbi:uncharacterized protein LOC110679542 [Aedes aegypti]|uniref:Uncharacterized protein n=1 Tax=Aedes aegypti TaxID=7159 RepID=A0A6I8U3F5_AEDAE|nr:uncharacterized protein LOC110679542 [Aedes aegypti]
MKVIGTIVVATLIICCESIEDPGSPKQRYDAAYRFQNQNGNRQEFHRPHRYRYVQQPPHNLNEDYMQYNQYQQEGRESIRTINNHQYLNRNNNHQNVQASVHRGNQDRKIIYQAVPYPVPVPDRLPHPTRKDINNHAVEIQQSIPIYMARQIYQVTNDGALRLISEEELRNPAPDANFNQRLLPLLFMQYPILIVKHEQH